MDDCKVTLSSLISRISFVANQIINGENATQIEVDILRDKLRQAYDLLTDFPLNPPVKFAESEIEQMEEEIKLKNEKVEVFENEDKETQDANDDFYDENEIEDETVETEQNKKEINDEQEEKTETIVANTSSVLDYLKDNIINEADPSNIAQNPTDLFSQVSVRVGDKFTENETLNDRVYETIMADLRTSIGVNEKFLFINDLFYGNLKAYTDFIQKLNESTTLHSAKKIIDTTKTERNWQENTPAYTTLNSIIDKRFKRNNVLT